MGVAISYAHSLESPINYKNKFASEEGGYELPVVLQGKQPIFSEKIPNQSRKKYNNKIS